MVQTGPDGGRGALASAPGPIHGVPRAALSAPTLPGYSQNPRNVGPLHSNAVSHSVLGHTWSNAPLPDACEIFTSLNPRLFLPRTSLQRASECRFGYSADAQGIAMSATPTGSDPTRCPSLPSRPRRGEIAPPSEADEHLLSEIAAGDRLALAKLYQRYAAQMHRAARRILHGLQDAEDVVHDVFLEICHRAQNFDPNRATARSWLLLLIRSRAIDRLRRTARERDHATAMLPLQSSIAPDNAAPVRKTEFMGLLRRLDCLSTEQRNVVELSYFHGLSSREIAARCRIPVGTVKSRLAAAIARLRHQTREPPRQFVSTKDQGTARSHGISRSYPRSHIGLGRNLGRRRG